MIRTSIRPKPTNIRALLPSRATLVARVFCQVLTLIALSASVGAGERPDRSIVDQLRKGGYVLYVRHFETDQSRDDTDPLHLENRSAQRPLTDAGRAQARAVGEAFRSLSIPIGRLICSQFDRTHESAKLMALGEPIATDDVSARQSASSADEKQRRIEALRKLLSTQPPAGRNTLIVSHNSNLEDAAGAEYGDVAEGEVVVFEPAAGGTFRKIARIHPPSIWTDWANAPR